MEFYSKKYDTDLHLDCGKPGWDLVLYINSIWATVSGERSGILYDAEILGVVQDQGDINGDVKAISLWKNAALVQLYSFCAAVCSVFLGCVVSAATLGFCHTGLCSGLFCCESGSVAVRQLGTAVIWTLKASELLQLRFRPYLWNHADVNIDYAAIALHCIVSSSFGGVCCRYRERAGQTPVLVSVLGTGNWNSLYWSALRLSLE